METIQFLPYTHTKNVSFINFDSYCNVTECLVSFICFFYQCFDVFIHYFFLNLLLRFVGFIFRSLQINFHYSYSARHLFFQHSIQIEKEIKINKNSYVKGS